VLWAVDRWGNSTPVGGAGASLVKRLREVGQGKHCGHEGGIQFVHLNVCQWIVDPHWRRGGERVRCYAAVDRGAWIVNR